MTQACTRIALATTCGLRKNCCFTRARDENKSPSPSAASARADLAIDASWNLAPCTFSNKPSSRSASSPNDWHIEPRCRWCASREALRVRLLEMCPERSVRHSARA